MSRPQLKTVAATIRVTPEVKAIWTAAATAERRSMANLFEVALREYVQRHPSEVEATGASQSGSGSARSGRKSVRANRQPLATPHKQD